VQRRVLVGLLTGCVFAIPLFRGEARGEDAPEAVFLRYRGAAGCPEAAAFREEFQARTTRAVLSERRERPGRTFTVTLTNEPGRIGGSLELESGAGSRATREVSGQTCAEVVSALSLVAALAVDPEASLSGGAGAAVSPGASPPAVTENRWRVAAGIGVGVVEGVLPRAAMAPSAFVEVADSDRSPRLVKPAFRFTLTGAAGGATATPRGSAHFLWGAAAVQACPLRLWVAGTLQGYPCGFGEVGFLAGQGSDVAEPDHRTRRWIAIGALLRLQWSPDERFFIDAEGAIRAPLTRDVFVFDLEERTRVHEVPGLGWTLDAGVGVRWP
jgi:hypothetical protein